MNLDTSSKAIFNDIVKALSVFAFTFTIVGVLGYFIFQGANYLYLHSPWWIVLGGGYFLLIITLGGLLVFIGGLSGGLNYLEKALWRLSFRSPTFRP